MAPIAFLGAGLLGSGMVRRFLKSGAQVIVWNRTAAKARALEADGAKAAATPQEAAQGADHVHIIVSDDKAVDGLLDQIAPALAPDAIVIDHTTTLPEATKARVDRVRKAGIRFLHAPVFMSPQMASDGVGLILVSGPQQEFDEARAELEGMTGEVWYLGERADLASAYKLFGNAMLFAVTAGLADIIAMARANGIDPVASLDIFRKFQLTNAIFGRGPRMALGEFSPSFTLEMARKDVGLMMTAAKGSPLVALPCIAKRMDDMIASGRGEMDLGAIAAAAV